MDALDSEVMEAPGASVPFYLEPILVNMERYRNIGPILPTYLPNLVEGRRSAGGGATRGGGSNGGGDRKLTPKVGVTGGTAQVQAHYELNLPYLSLQNGDN